MDARPMHTAAPSDLCDGNIGADGDIGAELVRWGVPAVIVLLCSIALLLVARRFAGALVAPLEASSLLATGSAAALGAWGLRRLWCSREQRPIVAWLDAAVRRAPSVAVVLIAAALSLPGASRLGLAGLWLVVVIAEVDIWRRTVGLRSGASLFPKAVFPKAAPSVLPPDEPLSSLGDEVLQQEVLQQDVLQQLTRSRDAGGCEVLHGAVRAEFAAGQRTENLHVAFCPPFARVPLLEVEQADGPDARIKLSQVLAYGVRIELRLARASSKPTSVVIELSARDAPPADRAG